MFCLEVKIMVMRIIVVLLLVLTTSYLCSQNFSVTIPEYEANVGMSVFQQDDGYLIIGTGYSDLFNDWRTLKIIKTDLQGNLLWKKQYGERSFSCFAGETGGAKQIDDNHYILPSFIGDSARAVYNAWLVKFNLDGDTVWTTLITNNTNEVFQDCKILPDSSIIAVGYSFSGNGVTGDLVVMKFSKGGQFLWRKKYGGNLAETGTSLELTTDGGFIVAGTTNSYGPSSGTNIFVVKADVNGIQQWQKVFGSSGDDFAARIVKSKNGGYYLSAHLDSIWGIGPNPCDNMVVKLSENGNVEWRKDFLSSKYEVIEHMIEEDNGLVFSGVTRNSLSGDDAGWFWKLDSLGIVIWNRVYEYDASPIKGAWFTDFKPTDDGGYVITGMASNPGTIFANRQDFWLVKIDSNGCLYPTTACVTGLEEVRANSLISVYPNPNFGQVTFSLPGVLSTVQLKMFSLTGQEVLSDVLFGGDNLIDIGSLSPGIYLYQITFNEHVQTGKLMLK